MKLTHMAQGTKRVFRTVYEAAQRDPFPRLETLMESRMIGPFPKKGLTRKEALIFRREDHISRGFDRLGCAALSVAVTGVMVMAVATKNNPPSYAGGTAFVGVPGAIFGLVFAYEERMDDGAYGPGRLANAIRAVYLALGPFSVPICNFIGAIYDFAKAGHMTRQIKRLANEQTKEVATLNKATGQDSSGS